jgi:hypothetical protein
VVDTAFFLSFFLSFFCHFQMSETSRCRPASQRKKAAMLAALQGDFSDSAGSWIVSIENRPDSLSSRP